MHTWKKPEDLLKEVIMVPIPFQTPFCHNTPMLPIFTYRDNSKRLFRQFRCEMCSHVSSRLVAVPKEKAKRRRNDEECIQ